MMGIYAKADLDTSWQDEANCLGVDPDLFFPERGASTREAKEVCQGCVVKAVSYKASNKTTTRS